MWSFTGSLFLDENGFPTEFTTFIGVNHVAVPTHFYKVILADNAAYAPTAAASLEMFTFAMANQEEELSGAPGDYLVSVDLVEFFSGLDFFSAFADSAEGLLEQEPASVWPIGEGSNS